MITKPLPVLNCSDAVLIGRSKGFLDMMNQVGRVAETDLPVLLTGESGTGKELVASALHKQSGRSNHPFVAVNCGAIPSELIESELFGHVKGSFTGADRDRQGLWEEAAGGTIFLDEITETSLAFQVKLLRTIQQGEIRSIGSNRTRSLDVRVIAASNRDIEREVEAGRFRQDLFYRLNAVQINLPPLRARHEDILLLAESFAIKAYSGKRPLGFSPEVVDVLTRYPWPGNIRELRHAIIRAVAMCGDVITAQDLPDRIRDYGQRQAEEIASAERSDVPRSINKWRTLAAAQANYVSEVLRHTNWNKQAASRILEVDRKTLARMIDRHKLRRQSAEALVPPPAIPRGLLAA
ncbi:MAG TPA: sigma-54 dependent transcriptional regulator [Pyrinomonadaceae bacterium]|nr:sigma-54 dependent transcriptional regulator [Pyrinomonadaceae bacterium]